MQKARLSRCRQPAARPHPPSSGTQPEQAAQPPPSPSDGCPGFNLTSQLKHHRMLLHRVRCRPRNHKPLLQAGHHAACAANATNQDQAPTRRRTFIRIGIVGAGAMARIHGAAWNKLPVTLAGCYDRHPERAAAYCQEFGGQPYASLAELLANIDVLTVCTHTDGHKDAV